MPVILRLAGGSSIWVPLTFRMLAFSRQNVWMPLNVMVLPNTSVTGLFFAKAFQALTCAGVSEPDQYFAKLVMRSRTSPRRVVKLWVGDTFCRMYAPAAFLL